MNKIIHKLFMLKLLETTYDYYLHTNKRLQNINGHDMLCWDVSTHHSLILISYSLSCKSNLPFSVSVNYHNNKHMIMLLLNSQMNNFLYYITYVQSENISFVLSIFDLKCQTPNICVHSKTQSYLHTNDPGTISKSLDYDNIYGKICIYQKWSPTNNKHHILKSK